MYDGRGVPTEEEVAHFRKLLHLTETLWQLMRSGAAKSQTKEALIQLLTFERDHPHSQHGHKTPLWQIGHLLGNLMNRSAEDLKTNFEKIDQEILDAQKWLKNMEAAGNQQPQ